MKIEMSKIISEISVVVIAEVDFLNKEESPYVNLLKGINSQKDLKEKLENNGLPERAIQNIIDNLKALKVICKDGINIKDGFPEREYGKYKITYYDNGDKKKPFSVYYKSIERIKPESCYDKNINVKSLKHNLVDDLNTNNSEIKIISIRDNKGIVSKKNKKATLKIIYDDTSEENWKCLINDKKIDCPVTPIPFNFIFKENWNISHSAYEEVFDHIKDDQDALVHFIKDYRDKDKDINNQYGKYDIKSKMVPIIPTKTSQNKWFMYLLKKELQSENNYFDKSELEQLWNNILYTVPQINIWGNIDYEYKKVLNQFNKKEEIYWLIRACNDLNPFEKKYYDRKNDDTNIVFSGERDYTSFKNDFNRINLNSAKSLIILDRYINTKHHFDALLKIKESFPKLSIIIYSQDFFNKVNKDDIQTINNSLKGYDIKRIVKEKINIPHTRYWKIDDRIYTSTSSIDFIIINKNKNNETTFYFKHTHFSEIHEECVEDKYKTYLKGV